MCLFQNWTSLSFANSMSKYTKIFSVSPLTVTDGFPNRSNGVKVKLNRQLHQSAGNAFSIHRLLLDSLMRPSSRWSSNSPCPLQTLSIFKITIQFLHFEKWKKLVFPNHHARSPRILRIASHWFSSLLTTRPETSPAHTNRKFAPFFWQIPMTFSKRVRKSSRYSYSSSRNKPSDSASASYWCSRSNKWESKIRITCCLGPNPK